VNALQSRSNDFDSSKAEIKEKTNHELKRNAKSQLKIEQNGDKNKTRQINGLKKFEDIKFNGFKENDTNKEIDGQNKNEDKQIVSIGRHCFYIPFVQKINIYSVIILNSFKHILNINNKLIINYLIRD
jgi:hypothetical protein